MVDHLGTTITQIRWDYKVLDKEFFKVLLKAMKKRLKYMYINLDNVKRAPGRSFSETR